MRSRVRSREKVVTYDASRDAETFGVRGVARRRVTRRRFGFRDRGERKKSFKRRASKKKPEDAIACIIYFLDIYGTYGWLLEFKRDRLSFSPVLGYQAPVRIPRPRGFRFPSRTEWMEGTGRDGNG